MNPKKIAEITFNIVDHIPSAREKFIEDYHFCPLCGDELLYTHNTHFADSVVKEEAQCQACNIRVKNNDHKLQ
jgi:hypothetical protein